MPGPVANPRPFHAQRLRARLARFGGRLALLLLWLPLLTAGCAKLPFPLGFPKHNAGPSGPPLPVFLENPLFIPAADADFLWDQLVDSVDDFFKIDREERLKVIGGNITEGRLSTFPITGATYFEPWRGDSAPGFERLHSTFQSTRRRASARVTPARGGYYVEIVVTKELEDLYQPEQATVGGSTLRHDGSVVRTEPRPGGGPATLGWMALGRDRALEQRLLSDIHARVVGDMPAPTIMAEPEELPLP